MSILDSIKHDLIGVAIVASALVLFSLLIKLTLSFKRRDAARKEEPAISAPDTQSATVECPADDAGWSSDEGLKLVNVDEKTAALIMAVVSHESGIPLSELRFKKIRLLS